MTLVGLSASQDQTQNTFSSKWANSDTYESQQVRDEWRGWLLEELYDDDGHWIEAFLSSLRLRVAEAGCGAGLTALLFVGESLTQHDHVGADVSRAVSQAPSNFEAHGIPGLFIQPYMEEFPKERRGSDFVSSERILHHPVRVEASLAHLESRLNPNGPIAVDVHAPKLPILEFTDDKDQYPIAGMTDDENRKALLPLTQWEKALGGLNISVIVPDDVALLGREQGTCDFQHLLVQKACNTCYGFHHSVDEVNRIPHDWFRSSNCHRHTPDEVVNMCASAGIKVERLLVELSDITVIAGQEGLE